MRWLGPVLITVTCGLGCARPNPFFDDSSNATSTGADTGSGPSATTSTSAYETQSSDDADASDSGLESSSGGEVPPCFTERAPLKDAFMLTGWDGCEVPCSQTNGGASVADVIEDVSEVERGYLLMSFDVSDVDWTDVAPDAFLELWVHAEFAFYDVEVYAVQPGNWVEGGGMGFGLAAKGESAWDWHSRPMPWLGATRGEGFEILLDQDLLVATEAFLGPTLSKDPEALEIPLGKVLDLADPQNVVHLAVTVTNISNMDLIPVLAYSSSSDWSPVLITDAC